MSKIKTSRNRKTCSVFGCMNSNLQNPDMAFFSLPSDPQRLSAWLALIDREDLANKPERHYRVCETHFDRTSILATSNRKVLKRNSVPTLRLPDTGRKDKGVQASLRLPLLWKPRSGDTDSGSLGDCSEDASLYCDEETAARGRGALYDDSGKPVARLQEVFQCNLCLRDISGCRYTCVQCADYDVCAACERRGAHAQHYVLRVPHTAGNTHAATAAVLSKIRQELNIPPPPTARPMDDDDSMKLSVKLEVDDPLDPGPDPLQQGSHTGAGDSHNQPGGTQPHGGNTARVLCNQLDDSSATITQNKLVESNEMPQSNVPIEQCEQKPHSETHVVPQNTQDTEVPLSPQSPLELDLGFRFEVFTHTSNVESKKVKKLYLGKTQSLKAFGSKKSSAGQSK